MKWWAAGNSLISQFDDRNYVASAELMSVTKTPWGRSVSYEGSLEDEPPLVPAREMSEAESPVPVHARQLRWFSVAGSLVLHVSLLLILAAWLLPRTVPDRGTTIETTMGTEEAAVESLEMASAESIKTSTANAPTDQLFAVSAASAATTQADSDFLQEMSVGLSAGATDGSGGSAGDGRKTIGFFGLEAEGSSFVFVVDFSGSMRGSRFSRARNELTRALDGLTPQQKFSVIFYNHCALPMYMPGRRNRLVPASRNALRRARRWIGQQNAHGGTFPDPALEMALAMKPDVIFFLSDGAFQRTARTVAKEANTHGAHIHTIAFEFDGGKLLLKGIAEDNDGRYRFVK